MHCEGASISTQIMQSCSHRLCIYISSLITILALTRLLSKMMKKFQGLHIIHYCRTHAGLLSYQLTSFTQSWYTDLPPATSEWRHLSIDWKWLEWVLHLEKGMPLSLSLQRRKKLVRMMYLCVRALDSKGHMRMFVFRWSSSWCWVWSEPSEEERGQTESGSENQTEATTSASHLQCSTYDKM